LKWLLVAFFHSSITNIFADGYFYPQGKSSAVILKFELFHTPTPEMGLVNDTLSSVLFIE